MTTTVTTSNTRHVLFRLGETARLPDALLATLRDEVVLTGWMRASGVLLDVRIRALGSSNVRSLTGAVQVIALEGSIGLSQGDVTCGLRAVLARETDSGGLETIAGEIVEARVSALEVMVTALDDVTSTREAGPLGVWLLDPTSAVRSVVAAPAPPAPMAAPAPAPPAPVYAPPTPPSNPELPKAAPSSPQLAPTPAAPVQAMSGGPRPAPTFTAVAMPQRPARPVQKEEEEQVYPDAGDVVEHFAFGRCDVVKSDGDRLHLRLGKDGRIKEIALEMLKVTPLPPVEGVAGKHFKLDRKL